MTNPVDNPDPEAQLRADLVGSLRLSAEERAELELELEQVRADKDRLAAALKEHTLRAVDRVTLAARAASTTAAELDAAVQAARGMGATWEQIARAAGMASRQAAWKRWSSPIDHDHGRHVIGGRCSVCNAEVTAP